MRVLLVLLALLAGPARAIERPVQVVSPGGVEAWLVTEPSIPMVAMRFVFDGGAVLDPDAALGATWLMTGLLDEGAGDLDALGFAERAQDLGARLSFSPGATSVSVGAQMLSETLDESVDLLALALTAPRFDGDAVARVRGQMLASIAARETSPGALLGEAYRETMYGDHPLARPSDGTADTVAALTVEDLRAAHARALVRDDVAIAVVGDITAGELGPILDRIFGDLPADGPPMPPPADVSDAGATVVISFDTTQSTARFAQPGLPRLDEDFMAAAVMNHILGGGLGSRLSQSIRVERGLTYGVSSFLDSDPLAPTFGAAVASSNDTIAEAIDLVRREWTALGTEGVTAAEVALAKRYLTGSYPLQLVGNGQLAGALAQIKHVGLPIDHVLTRNDEIEALTAADVNRVAADLVRPDALSVIVVGTPEGVAAD